MKSIVSLMVACALMLVTGTAFGADYEISFIVDDAYPTGLALNDSNDVAWVGKGLWPALPVYLYDGETGITSIIGQSNGNVIKLNNRGDVMWKFNDNIIYYDNDSGQAVNITNSSFRIADLPDMNNNGDIVWADGGTGRVFLYEKATGIVSQISPEIPDFGCGGTDIGDNGNVVFACSKYDPSSGISQSDIYLYDRAAGTAVPLTDDIFEDSAPVINSRGDVAWGRNGEVMLYDAASGTILRLANNLADIKLVINDMGDVLWKSMTNLHLYDNASGSIKELPIGWDYSMNNKGDIVSCAYVPEIWGRYDVFVYENSTGTITQVTSTPDRDENRPQINSSGNLVWLSYHMATRTQGVAFAKRLPGIYDITGTINDLLSSGEIPASAANGLSATLDNALNAENSGNTTASDNLLQAFIRQVEAQLKAGKISSETATILIEAARANIGN